MDVENETESELTETELTETELTEDEFEGTISSNFEFCDLLFFLNRRLILIFFSEITSHGFTLF